VRSNIFTEWHLSELLTLSTKYSDAKNCGFEFITVLPSMHGLDVVQGKHPVAATLGTGQQGVNVVGSPAGQDTFT
jgi:hypothetical protein